MWAKASNDCSTPTRKGSCRLSSCASACLCCVSVSSRSVLSCRRSLTRATISLHSCAWPRPLQHSSPACAAPRKRLVSLSASASYGSRLKKFLWGVTPPPFAAASPSLHGPRKMMAPSHGQPQIPFCGRGVSSPLLANIYLHYVFDLWVDVWRRRHALGDVIVVRYADDIVL